MGLFDNKGILEKTIREIAYSNYEYNNEISSYNFDSYVEKFRDEDMLSEVLRKLALNDLDFSLHMKFLTSMYTAICINRDKNEEKSIYRGLVDLYVNNPDIFINQNNFEKVNSAFDDKRIVLEFFRFLIQNDNIVGNDNLQNISLLVNYLVDARQYYVDDRALLSSAMKLINNFDPAVLKHGDLEFVKKIIDDHLRQDQKANGIYDTDSYTLAEMDRKLEIISSSSSNLENLLQKVEQKIKQLSKIIGDAKGDLNNARIKELSALENKSATILKEFNEKYEQLLTEQRESLIDERDTLLSEVGIEIEKRKTDLLSIADGLGKRMAIELGRVSNATNASVKKLKEFVESDESIQKLIKETRNNDDFITRLAQFEKLASQIPVANDEDVSKIIPSDIGVVSNSNQDLRSNLGNSPLIMPSIIIPQIEQRVVDPKINYYFDKRIPFKDRFAQLMELKQKDIEENKAIYHEKFDDILKIIIQDQKPPYMYGPSGCGKTYLVEEQIARLLGMHVVTNGYVLYEQDIIGYTNSGTGAYVPGNFYRCYKYGDIIFLDELDNGIANATVVLNRFMGRNKSYTFPDGIDLPRHPNFRIIAAGNTKGNGRTSAYNTRQKMDESVMQRVTPVELNYDNRIELRILQDYKDWYNFSINFRKAIEQVPSDSGEEKNTVGTFTTRDAETIKAYLDDKCFDDSEIMEYEIIQTKDIDYLSKISQKMEDMQFSKGGKQLQKLFNQQLNQKKSDRR